MEACEPAKSSEGTAAGGPQSALPLGQSTFPQAAAVCGFLFVMVVLVFSKAVGYGFVNYDDEQYVVSNPNLIDGLTAESICWSFTTNRCSNWHPLTWISYLLDYQVCGFKPWVYHLENVLLHAATAIALFLLLWRITGFLWPGAFVAAVFAVHPLRVESVVWISERKDVLSGLLFMLTLAAYAGYVRRPFSLPRYLGVAALFALGLMVKPMLVTLPLVLLLLDCWPLRRMALKWRLVVEKLPLLALSATSCLMTLAAQTAVIKELDRLPMSSRLGNAVVSYATYIVQLFYPVNLAVLYPISPDGPAPRQVVLALLFLAVISTAVVLLGRRRPWLVVGWLWYLGMLVPVIGLMQVGDQSRADRYTYLPQIGLLIALAWAANATLRSWPYRAWLYGISSAAALAILMGCTWRQTSYWCDSETLWKHTLACTDRNVTAHNNLGAFLTERGQLDEAIVQFNEALEINPQFAMTHYNYGMTLATLGRLDEALVQYRKALELVPDYPEAHDSMALTLVRRGELDEAIVHFRKAVELAPDYASARQNLEIALSQKKRRDESSPGLGVLPR